MSARSRPPANQSVRFFFRYQARPAALIPIRLQKALSALRCISTCGLLVADAREIVVETDLTGTAQSETPPGLTGVVVQFDAPRGGSNANCTTRNRDSDAVAAVSGGLIGDDADADGGITGCAAAGRCGLRPRRSICRRHARRQGRSQPGGRTWPGNRRAPGM